MKLFLEAMIKFTLGLALVFALVFLPAGTFEYFQGKLLICVMFVPMFFVGIVMMVKNPQLLKMRLDIKEKQREQKAVVCGSSIMFIFGFIVSGINFRKNIYMLPLWVSCLFSVLFLFGYFLFAVVLIQNKYLSRTIKVQDGQNLIDKGLYSVVRHPMYSATLIMFMSVPVILGSVYSILIFLAYPFLIAVRINNEEKVLEKELSGYTEYKSRVEYRLIPYIW